MAKLALCLTAALAGLSLVVVGSASAHPERPSFYPNYPGKVPQYRTSGPSRVVCAAESLARLRAGSSDPFGEGGSATDSSRQSGGSNRDSILQQNENRSSDPTHQRNIALLERCRYRTIQSAVNAARNGDRILILPGTYREEPSRRVPSPDRRCRDEYTSGGDPTALVSGLSEDVQPLAASERAPTYAHHRKCPNSHNLIAIVGDRLSDPDRRCDDKCNLQIEGMGDEPRDVRIVGARHKDNVIRADRADGIVLRNFLVQFSDFNNIYVHETNGFRESDILTRWSREYGALSFTSDHGLYERMSGYGAGDSVIYPGSGPQRADCGKYGIEVRNVDAHHSTIGYSGTAGDSVYVHHSRFHHNSAGLTTDSFASGHPGMPQDCARFENNLFHSNNVNYFTESRDEYCRNTPPRERDRRVVCPAFQVPVGTGLMIGGGNGNVVKNNFFFDNWRNGVRLLWVPASARGEPPTANQFDTSHNNKFLANRMSVRPDGTRDPNGQDPTKGDGYADFWWDEEGNGNCWRGNVGPGGRPPTTNFFRLACPASPHPTGVNPSKFSSQAPCAAWDPSSPVNDDPPGCDWFRTPPEPR